MRRQGNIKSIPVTKPSKGLQVAINSSGGVSRVSKIAQILQDGFIILEDESQISLEELRIIEVEQTSLDAYYENGYGSKTKLPLHLSEWDLVIQREEVDTEKTIIFEVSTQHKMKPDGSLDFGYDFDVAKIVRFGAEHNYQIGELVYHQVDRAPFQVVGIRKTEVEIYGDWSGGTHPDTAKDADWVNYKEVQRVPF